MIVQVAVTTLARTKSPGKCLAGGSPLKLLPSLLLLIHASARYFCLTPARTDQSLHELSAPNSHRLRDHKHELSGS